MQVYEDAEAPINTYSYTCSYTRIFRILPAYIDKVLDKVCEADFHISCYTKAVRAHRTPKEPSARCPELMRSILGVRRPGAALR